MELSRIEPLAGGRIWTGRQAKQNGLIDELGTLTDAIAEAKKLGGVKADEKTEQLILPKPRNFLDQLFDSEMGIQALRGSQRETTAPLVRALAEVEQLQRLFRERSLFLMPHRVEIR
jgi:protease-4